MAEMAHRAGAKALVDGAQANAAEKAGVISIVLNGIPSEQVGSALNREGIAVRSGRHCAQPILRRLGCETTVRPSFAFYNTCAEIDALAAALHRIQVDNGRARAARRTSAYYTKRKHVV